MERRVTFQIGAAFRADDAIARWIASLSMALNDIRTAGEYAVRGEQPKHERIYFVRVLASHIREAVKIVVLEHRERQDVQDFVASMPEDARGALVEIERRLDEKFTLRPETTLFREIKRLRDDTFHYARDAPSQDRLRDAMERSAGDEGSYLVADQAPRAEYADVIRTRLVHPFDGSDPEIKEQAREMHEAILELIGPLSTFLHHAEVRWLNMREPGVVRWP